MVELENEMWLAQRLRDHRGPDVFEGDTNSDARKQRFREAIKACGLESVVIGAKKGSPVNWRQAFESLYGELL